MKVELERESWTDDASPDSISIHVNGGMSGGGVTIRFHVPLGHDAEDVFVEQSTGHGWDEVKGGAK